MAKTSLFRSSRGGVVVEFALLTPIVFLLLWFFSLASFSWRLEGAVHRATASLAEVVANQRLHLVEGEGEESLNERLQASGMDTVFSTMFHEMVAGNLDAIGTSASTSEEQEGEKQEQANVLRDMMYGITITIYNSKAPDTGPKTFTMGTMTCPTEESPQTLVDYGTFNGRDSLVTEANIGGLILVRVNSCVQYEAPVLEKIVMPSLFESSFTAVRREE